jgi:tetratricopeptide (TPR) repeat protein
MSTPEWFRRATLTDLDRQDFNARLLRSRGAGKRAQFLCIQAIHLAEAGLHAACIELLDRLPAEYPDKTELASAHLQRAESLASLGQTGPAIDEFRAAFQAERDSPCVHTNAWLDFAWFAVERGLTDLYDEVLAAIKEFRDEAGLTFPSIEYRYWAAQAVIAQTRNNHSAAHTFATSALAAASRDHSGLKYLAKVGLVTSQPQWMEMKLRAIVAS